MDPNFIHLDWERTFDALMLVAVIAVIIERSLSVVFQSSVYIERVHRDGLKELIAVGLSIAVCVAWKFDAVGMIILTETTTVPGYILTGALVAGGSKGSLKLFQDILHLQSSSYQMRHTIEAARAASDAENALSKAEAAGTMTTAEVEYAKAATALKRVKIAAAKAAADGKPVPEEAVRVTELSLTDARAVLDRRQSQTP